MERTVVPGRCPFVRGRASAQRAHLRTYFSAQTPSFGYELWRSDGTPEGTFLLQNLDLTRSSYPESPAEVGGTLFFQADDGRVGEELWALSPCGDGVVNPAEDCDDGNLEPGDGCSDLCRLKAVVTTSTTTSTSTSTASSSTTTPTTSTTVTSSTAAPTTTGTPVTTTPTPSSSSTTLAPVCVPDVPSTCDVGACPNPRLRRKAARIATSIEHALGSGREPKARMIRRFTSLLVRCGILERS